MAQTPEGAPACAGATVALRLRVKKAFPIRFRSASSCSMRSTAILPENPAARGDARQTVAGIILPEGNDKFDKFRRLPCAGAMEQLAICLLFRQWRASPQGIEEGRRGASMVLRQRSVEKGKIYGSV